MPTPRFKTMLTERFISESHQDSTIGSLKRDIEAFKRECRPAGRGRPARLGARYFHINGHIVGCSIGESCLGAGGWGITVGLMLNGSKASLAHILRALAA